MLHALAESRSARQVLWLHATRDRQHHPFSAEVRRLMLALPNDILELAEACDVPVRWSCRTGVCHSCESGLVSGAVVYGPEPLEKPADGNLLVCCSQPAGDVVIDLCA